MIGAMTRAASNIMIYTDVFISNLFSSIFADLSRFTVRCVRERFDSYRTYVLWGPSLLLTHVLDYGIRSLLDSPFGVRACGMRISAATGRPTLSCIHLWYWFPPFRTTGRDSGRYRRRKRTRLEIHWATHVTVLAVVYDLPPKRTKVLAGRGAGPLGVGPTMRRRHLAVDQHCPYCRLSYRRPRRTFFQEAGSPAFFSPPIFLPFPAAVISGPAPVHIH
jgi:hypothetical protein